MAWIARNGEWLTTSVGDEFVMMSVSSGKYIVVSAVGARVWDLIAEPVDLDALCRRLTEEFEVSAEQCRADVLRFIAEMEQNGAVKLDPSDGAPI